MPFASERSRTGQVHSQDLGTLRQARLWFYAEGSPRQPLKPQCQTALRRSAQRIYGEVTQMSTNLYRPTGLGALNPRPEERGTPRIWVALA